MLTMLLYVLIVGLVAALLFLVASAVFGRAEELGPLPEGTTETVLPAEGISGADVRDLRFQQVFRGYKAGEVDWALARLAARIDELEGQLARSRGESPNASGGPVERPGSGSVPGPWTGAVAEQSARHPSGPEQPVERPVRTENQAAGEERTVRTERHGGPQASTPATQSAGTGPIPWHGPVPTGPWEAPSGMSGNGAAPEEYTGSWTAVPQVSRAEQTAPASGAESSGSLALPSVAPAPSGPAFGRPPAQDTWPGNSGTTASGQL